LNRRVARPNPQLAIDPVRAPDRFAAPDEAKLVSIIFSMVRTKGTAAFSAPKLRQTPTIYDQLTRQASLFRVEKHFDNHFPLFLAPAGNLRLPGIAR
jgi:hypothetical protein